MISKYVFSVVLATAFLAVTSPAAEEAAKPRTYEFDLAKSLAANKKSILPHRPDKGQMVEVSTVENRQVLRVEFNCEETPWTQIFCYGKDFVIPGTFSKAVIKVAVFNDAESNLNNIRLLLIDKDRESFQTNGNFNAKKTGWQEVRFEIDTAKKLSCWGGKPANKQIDFPANFRGFTFSYKSKHGIGEAKIGKVTIEVQ